MKKFLKEAIEDNNFAVVEGLLNQMPQFSESEISQRELNFAVPGGTKVKSSSNIAQSGVERGPNSVGELLHLKHGFEKRVDGFDHHPLIPLALLAEQRKHGVAGTHAMAVVVDPNQLLAALLDFDGIAASPGVERVLDQFRDGIGGTFDSTRLACHNAIRETVAKSSTARARSRRAVSGPPGVSAI